MFKSLKSLFRPSLTPLAERLTNVTESHVEGWVRTRQGDPAVATDALALLTMMAAGRFLKSHLYPPPSYLGKVHLDVLAYEVLRYVKSAVSVHLPDSRFLVMINSDIFLRSVIERETDWQLEDMDFMSYLSSGKQLAEDFLFQLEQLSGLTKPSMSVSLTPVKPDFKQRLSLLASIAAFQQTTPPAIAEVLEKLITTFNLHVDRDDELEAVASRLNPYKNQ